MVRRDLLALPSQSQILERPTSLAYKGKYGYRAAGCGRIPSTLALPEHRTVSISRLGLRSYWLAVTNAISDPRWRTARSIKLRQHPICQVRVRCSGAVATDITPLSSSLDAGSLLNPANLQATCPACRQWKLSIGGLRVHA